MPQTRKPEVRERMVGAALRCFAEQGYPGTSMAAIAAAAGTAPGNLYRYFPSKEALFDAAVPGELAPRHDALLDARIAALAVPTRTRTETAEELLAFWLDHRAAVVVLLDHADGTPYAGYPAAFVQRLVSSFERAVGKELDPVHREVVGLVFDGTRRALARILAGPGDREHIRTVVEGFWSYQVPGLDGLLAWVAGRSPSTSGP